jgi:ribosomal protein L35AE/L33A
MYAKARVLGFTRGKRNQKENTSLVQVEGVSNREEAEWYFGKVNLRICSVRFAASGLAGMDVFGMLGCWVGWDSWKALSSR